jgi:hypothetical protein
MESKKDTIDVMGKQFLKCQQEDCEWNIGWLGGIAGPKSLVRAPGSVTLGQKQ